jgi:hypothetical protein
LVFNYRNAENYSFWAFFGDESAWILGDVQKGQLKRQVRLGSFERLEKWKTVGLRRLPDGSVVAYASGQGELPLARSFSTRRGIGLLVMNAPARFRNVLVSLEGSVQDDQGLLFSVPRKHLESLAAGSVVVRLRGPCGRAEYAVSAASLLEELRAGER